MGSTASWTFVTKCTDYNHLTYHRNWSKAELFVLKQQTDSLRNKNHFVCYFIWPFLVFLFACSYSFFFRTRWTSLLYVCVRERYNHVSRFFFQAYSKYALFVWYGTFYAQWSLYVPPALTINNSAFCISGFHIILRTAWTNLILVIKSCPTTRHEGAWAERRQSSYSVSTSALDGGEWSASCPGLALAPGKGPPVSIVQEAGWAPEPVWTQRLEEESFRLCRGSNLDRPVCIVRHDTDWSRGKLSGYIRLFRRTLGGSLYFRGLEYSNTIVKIRPSFSPCFSQTARRRKINKYKEVPLGDTS
jgi:hypothetical protein